MADSPDTPPPDDINEQLIDAPERFRYVALALTVSLTLSALIALGVIAALVASVSASGRIDPVRYLIALLGVLVAFFAMGLAAYLLFAPRTNLPFTPTRQPPDRYPLILVGLGLVLFLSHIRAFTPQNEVVFFWRVAALVLAAGLFSGVAVFVIITYTGFEGFHNQSNKTE